MKYVMPVILMILLLSMLVFPMDDEDMRMAIWQHNSDHRCVIFLIVIGTPIIITCAIIVIIQVLRHFGIVIKNFFK